MTKSRKFGFLLLWVVTVPIILQFAHVLHHHVDFKHAFEHVLQHEHNHKTDNTKTGEHCKICEYDFASFDVVNVLQIGQSFTILLEKYQDFYTSVNPTIKIEFHLLRGPPALIS